MSGLDIVMMIFLGLLLVAMLAFVWKRKRRNLKIVLNTLLWLSIVMLVYPPEIQNIENTKTLNIISEPANSDLLDSLNINKLYTVSEIENHENPNFIDGYQNINFYGENFSEKFLSDFSGKKCTYFPMFENDEIRNINWSGVLNQYQNQKVSGNISIKKSGWLKMKIGNLTLDSMATKAGLNYFNFEFQSFGLGRNTVELYQGNEKKFTVRFFVTASTYKKVLVLLPYPDFESKTLSEWLAKNGHDVEIRTRIAKNKSQISNFNPDKEKKDFDLIITSIESLESALKLKKKDARILVFRLTEPQSEVKRINKTTGSTFGIKKISGNQNIELTDMLTSAPYEFYNTKSSQSKKHLAFDRTGVAVSLLNETFGVAMSGDSLGYHKIWTETLNTMSFDEKSGIKSNAPLGMGTESKIEFYGNKSDQILFGNDTLNVTNSAINDNATYVNYIPKKAGWIKVNENSEIYVEDSTNAITNRLRIEDFVTKNTFSFESNEPQSQITLSIKWLYALVLIGLAMVWIESKF